MVQVAQATVNGWSLKLAYFAVSLLERPEYRLAGAEAAFRGLVDTIERVCTDYDPLLKEINVRAGCARAADEIDGEFDGFRSIPPYAQCSAEPDRVDEGLPAVAPPGTRLAKGLFCLRKLALAFRPASRGELLPRAVARNETEAGGCSC